MKFTLKDMAEAGYIMGLSTIGEVATHMESHHYAYFDTTHFDADLHDFQYMIDGHEDDSIDLYLSDDDKRRMDDELAKAMSEGPGENPVT